MQRRDFFKNTFKIIGFGCLGGFYSTQIEPFWVEHVRIKMPLMHLPMELVGKSIMQISDIHIGSDFDFQFIIRSFIEAAALKPDYVVYTGDFVSLVNGEVDFHKLKKVMKYAVRGKEGTLGVLGNHDYGMNWAQPDVADKISEVLTFHGVHILRNASVTIGGIIFIGLDDYFGTNFSPEQPLKVHPVNQPSIVLCHNPEVCDLDIWGDFEGWILAGHTHGGQVKLPFVHPPVLPVKNKSYTSGIFHLDKKRTLYINRALGHLKQVRFNVRPESQYLN